MLSFIPRRRTTRTRQQKFAEQDSDRRINPRYDHSLVTTRMCIWTKAEDDSIGGRLRRQSVRRHHYRWDLDDGFPGFIRETRRKRLRLYLDSDRNGSFSEDDDLIGSARIRAVHRQRDRGQLLNPNQAGSIQALTIEADHQDSNQHVKLEPGVDLQLLHPDGSLVALFAGVQV